MKKITLFITLSLLFSQFSFSNDDPFFTELFKEWGSNKTLAIDKLSSKNSNNAELFLKYSNRLSEHSNDAHVSHLYTSYFNHYYELYNPQQVDQLLTLLISNLNSLEINDEDLINEGRFGFTFEQALYSIFDKTESSLKNEVSEQLIKSLDTRLEENNHKLFKELKVFAQNGLIDKNRDERELNTLKLQWKNANTIKKKGILNKLKLNQGSNNWVTNLLNEKNNKGTIIAILTFLASNHEAFPNNKNVVMEYISKDQRFPYIKIAKKYFGEEEVDEHLNSINNQ